MFKKNCNIRILNNWYIIYIPITKQARLKLAHFQLKKCYIFSQKLFLNKKTSKTYTNQCHNQYIQKLNEKDQNLGFYLAFYHFQVKMFVTLLSFFCSAIITAYLLFYFSNIFLTYKFGMPHQFLKFMLNFNCPILFSPKLMIKM